MNSGGSTPSGTTPGWSQSPSQSAFPHVSPHTSPQGRNNLNNRIPNADAFLQRSANNSANNANNQIPNADPYLHQLGGWDTYDAENNAGNNAGNNSGHPGSGPPGSGPPGLILDVNGNLIQSSAATGDNSAISSAPAELEGLENADSQIDFNPAAGEDHHSTLNLKMNESVTTTKEVRY
jgi:hypothetical protein